MGETPKGSDWRKKLAEAGAVHMLKISKQMTDVDVSMTLSDMRTVNVLATKFSDILFEEQELRKRNKKLLCA